MTINLKLLLVKVIPFIFLPLFALIKALLYKPFVHLYLLIFKIKKHDLGTQSKEELLKKKSFHFAAIIFIVVAILFNLNSKKPASASLGKQKISVMAELVKNEFNDIGYNNEELIQETAQNMNWQFVGINNYLEKDDLLKSPRGLGAQEEEKKEEEEEIFIARQDESEALSKPRQVTDTEEVVRPTTSEITLEETSQRTEIIEYTVQSGDTISAIARRFQLNINTILWANNLNSFSIIRPGNTLSILPSDGFLYKVKSGDTIGRLAQVYRTSPEKIIDSNNLDQSGNIRIGQELIIPGTRVSTPSPSRSVAQTSTPSPAISATIRDIVSSDSSVVSSDRMLWPTPGRRITQYFSWAHNGLDIADRVGTPIYASESGVVELSQGGWNGGYGNMILINHGSGKKTRYAHASQLLVSKGEQVEKGQVIALMGSTGRSTGPHLHFEVIINGTRYNPLNYIR